MADSHYSIHKVANLLSFFRAELTETFEKLGLTTSPETQAYLVHMLQGYVRLDSHSAVEVGFHKPAALLLGEAMNSVGDRRIEAYRRLGDASLFSCGFFEKRLARAPVSPDYYRRVGRTAYSNLGELMEFKQPGGTFYLIFCELAQKFDTIVDALRHLSGSADSEQRLDQLIERWQRGEAFDTAHLLRLGVLPAKNTGEA
jgi:hypothetical protein